MIENAVNHDDKFKEILFSSGFLGQKIYADYLTQKSSVTNSFYLSNNCAFMLSGVNLTLCGDVITDDIEQIVFFCQFFGVQTVESQILNLPLKISKKLIIMEYRGDISAPLDGIIKNENIYLFIKFCCDNFYGISFDNVYANFAKKVNCGLSQIFYIKKDENIASGAIATDYFDNTQYITFVSTAPQHRKSGMAKAVLSHIISQNQGKKILLKCENSLVEFYTELGFKAVDTITINHFEGK